MLWPALILLLGGTGCDDGGSGTGPESQGGDASREGRDSGPGPGCEYRGKTYEVGAVFDHEDGCNTCSCESDGELGCSLINCDALPAPEDDRPGAAFTSFTRKRP